MECEMMLVQRRKLGTSKRERLEIVDKDIANGLVQEGNNAKMHVKTFWRLLTQSTHRLITVMSPGMPLA
jgi:hypothetical protein